MSLSLVLFDVDGTLVDSADLLYRTHLDTFAALGLEPPARSDVLRLVGLSLPVMFERLVGSEGPVSALEARYRAFYAGRVSDGEHRDTLFPGADDLVRRLAASPGTAVGLVTGKSRRGVARIVETQGWGGLFATVQTADDAPSKPHPAMVLQAMEETGVAAADTIVVGDTTFDMLMARSAGARAIGVSWGHHCRAELIEAGACRVIDSFAELQA